MPSTYQSAFGFNHHASRYVETPRRCQRTTLAGHSLAATIVPSIEAPTASLHPLPRTTPPERFIVTQIVS
jgi:hypothetical protein